MQITHAARLTDSELVTEVARLAGGEREATVALIVHLAEFDARRLFEGAGFSSTFRYCVEVLRLSEDAAFNRIEAARLARRCPAVIDMLIAGALSPTTARMLDKYLTPENQQELLAAASGKSKQALERLLAGQFPEPDLAPLIRKLPLIATRIPPVSAPTMVPAANPPSAYGGEGAEPTTPSISAGVDACASAPERLTPRPVVRPLAAERYVIRFTASAETCDKLRLAQDLLGHAVPSGDLAEVFDRALTVLVEDLQRKKFAATQRPRASRGQSDVSRNIPAEVRRAVAMRDGGRCAFVASTGRRCAERRFLEFHHVHPYGVGGKPTVDNIQFRCRAHNRYEAELFYGPTRRNGGDGMVSEARAAYKCVTETQPVPERVMEWSGATS